MEAGKVWGEAQEREPRSHHKSLHQLELTVGRNLNLGKLPAKRAQKKVRNMLLETGRQCSSRKLGETVSCSYAEEKLSIIIHTWLHTYGDFQQNVEDAASFLLASHIKCERREGREELGEEQSDTTNQGLVTLNILCFSRCPNTIKVGWLLKF